MAGHCSLTFLFKREKLFVSFHKFAFLPKKLLLKRKEMPSLVFSEKKNIIYHVDSDHFAF